MVLHRDRTLTSRDHLPSWALFAFSAGAVNSGALLACSRFVAHVTGTITRIGLDAGELLALDYALVLFAFIAGAAAAILIVRRLDRYTRFAYWLPLTIVSFVIAGVAVAGALGGFGRFGGSVETAHDFVLLAILSFAMGMQNAAVGASTNNSVRTTHMTGPATDIGVAVAMLATGTVSEREGARRSLLLRGTKLVAFIVGAGAMAVLCPRIGWLAFLLPAVTGVIATVRSYSPYVVREVEEAEAEASPNT